MLPLLVPVPLVVSPVVPPDVLLVVSVDDPEVAGSEAEPEALDPVSEALEPEVLPALPAPEVVSVLLVPEVASVPEVPVLSLVSLAPEVEPPPLVMEDESVPEADVAPAPPAPEVISVELVPDVEPVPLAPEVVSVALLPEVESAPVAPLVAEDVPVSAAPLVDAPEVPVPVPVPLVLSLAPTLPDALLVSVAEEPEVVAPLSAAAPAAPLPAAPLAAGPATPPEVSAAPPERRAVFLSRSLERCCFFAFFGRSPWSADAPDVPEVWALWPDC